ncbi:nucleoid-associated protein [Sphingomonas sp.]|uniref:nucleoid-associated protein n=1 Tax=Sphingomonas sp. TaxID=28214 RepID=UPI0025E8264F|nr:nucleoid-associated protein [Sphingomonas sp.]
MPFLTDAERDDLRIDRMIFHVVGPDLDDPVLLAEFDPPIFTEFFLGRVKSALGGNAYRFRPDSPTMATLREIGGDDAAFVGGSERLAAAFQHEHRKNSIDGVFFLFLLSTGEDRRLFALVKYDNDQVLKYDIADRDGQRRAILEEFRQTFSTKRESLQKIALVRLGDEDGELMVRDRSRPDGISEYFEKFLRVRRAATPAEFTKKAERIFKDVLKQHRDDLDPEVVKGGARRINEQLRATREFGPDTQGQLFDSIFGVLPEESPVRRTFRRKLASQRLDEETFRVDVNAIPRPRRKRIETVEGIQILFDEEVRNRIERRDLDTGDTEIRITTARVTVDDDDALERIGGA